MTANDDTLDSLRAEIDACDDALLEVAAKRLAIAGRIAGAKAASGDMGSVFRFGREADMINRHLRNENLAALKPLEIEAVLRQSIAFSLARQKESIGVAHWGDGVAAVARFRFGVAAEYTRAPSADAVLDAVAGGNGRVLGMLPHWDSDGGDWAGRFAAMRREAREIYIAAETPLVMTGRLMRTALIAPHLPDKSEKDMTLIYDESAGCVKAIEGYHADAKGLIGITQKVITP